MADALAGLAPMLRVQPELETICRMGAQWSLPHPPPQQGWINFHLVTRGGCHVDLGEMGLSLALEAGDILLLPRMARHRVRGPDTPADAPATAVTFQDGPITIKTNGLEETELLCGRLRPLAASEALWSAALPPMLHITTDQADGGRMRGLLTGIGGELAENAPGAAAIATDLANALLMMALRSHLSQPAPGLLALLGHRQASRALTAMLDDPARAWGLDELAALALVSRASLVRLFRRLAGMAPLETLTLLRLEKALGLVTATDLPLGEIAERVGYQSESAFSHAFSRHFGRPPGTMREAR